MFGKLIFGTMYLLGMCLCVTDLLAIYGERDGTIVLYNMIDMELATGNSGWLAMVVWLLPVIVGIVGLFLAATIQKNERKTKA